MTNEPIQISDELPTFEEYCKGRDHHETTSQGVTFTTLNLNKKSYNELVLLAWKAGMTHAIKVHAQAQPNYVQQAIRTERDNRTSI